MSQYDPKNLIPAELIRKKRDGQLLDEDDIRSFVIGIRNGHVSSEQIAAFTMAVWFRGLNTDEQRNLTFAIRDSGTTLQWPDLSGPVVDKHSTGGVGDMVSFLAGPILAACGAYVPMISGRGLGHTGGTLDKLESFPGINVTPDIATFRDWVKQRGLAIIGQTPELAPADRRMYAVRDATATVDSIPLIVSSILGKKLCEGLDALVLDIKVGSGAFMPELEKARALASEICAVTQSASLPCSAVLTDMNQPMAWTAGNALEMREVIDYLVGKDRNPRLHEIVLNISAEMLRLTGLADSSEAAIDLVEQTLDSGRAAEEFEALIIGQGGPQESIESLAQLLPEADIVRPVYSARPGYVRRVDLKVLGMSVVALGGGRKVASDSIDHSVGLARVAEVGKQVGPDEPLVMIHAADESSFEQASAMVVSAYTVGTEKVTVPDPVILGRETVR
ncbi:MAG TPA: thymidine phosphorylase [Xanthomonadales bacterium]|nr:thymidine phosphorylase [Xanthomonadales bacterium]